MIKESRDYTAGFIGGTLGVLLFGIAILAFLSHPWETLLGMVVALAAIWRGF